jgi:hypothetical protein
MAGTRADKVWETNFLIMQLDHLNRSRDN